jgi:predicted alpha/beta hydrolase family esterase
MKKANGYDLYLILHGCPQDPKDLIPHEKRWMNWLAGKLQEKGLNAIAPDMPSPWNPDYEKWKMEFDKYQITENTQLIGHSCGGGFLVRWLLDTKKKVKKLILVAPAKTSIHEDRKSFYDFDLPNNASEIADSIVIFISNDTEGMLKSFEVYNKFLKPKVIRLENKKHFLYFQMNTVGFPELLDEALV